MSNKQLSSPLAVHYLGKLQLLPGPPFTANLPQTRHRHDWAPDNDATICIHIRYPLVNRARPVVSTILIPAAISSFFGGHLANKVGRLRGIALGALVFGIGASIEGSSVALGMLIAGRAVKGIGEGLFLSTSVA